MVKITIITLNTLMKVKPFMVSSMMTEATKDNVMNQFYSLNSQNLRKFRSKMTLDWKSVIKIAFSFSILIQT